MSTVVKDLGAVSAYAYAVEKGYTGTEAEFAELMADYANVGQRAEDAADSALESKTAAQTAATTATDKASEATTAAQTATNKADEATTAADTATTAKNDAVAAKTAAETAQGKAEDAQAAAESVAESIPSDYSQLSEDVSDLKEDLTNIASEVNFYVQLQRNYNGNTKYYGYAGSDGKLVSNTAFVTYYFTVIKDAQIYCDLTNLGTAYGTYFSIAHYSGAISNTTFLARYRLSDNNLPTENDKISVSENDVVAVTINNTTQNSDFIIWQDMTTSPEYLLGSQVVLNNAQIDQAQNKGYVSVSNGKMYIYSPLKRGVGYAYFSFERYTNASINEDTWRLYSFGITDEDFKQKWNPQTNIEWEGVVKVSGADDFIGGYHGDENYTSLTVMIDGVFVDLSSDTVDLQAFDNIDIVVTSTLNKCNDPNTDYITRYKHITFKDYKMILENRWVILETFTAEAFYPAMMSILIFNNNDDGAKYGRYNDKYAIQDLTTSVETENSPYNRSGFANVAEMWNSYFLARLSMIKGLGDTHEMFISPNQINNRKAYFRNIKYTFATGDDIVTEAEYEFI